MDIKEKEELTNCLKKLRKDNYVSVKELAEKTNVHLSSIHKIEVTPGEVKICSIRKVYRNLCSDEAEWANLLLLWAMVKDNGEISLGVMRDTMEKARRENIAIANPWFDEVIKAIQMVAEADLSYLPDAIREYATNPYARGMVSNWMESHK